MKKTTLHSVHISRGAKMVPFGDYEMPLHYGSIQAEHIAVRENAGLFDVSHMGLLYIEGKEAGAFVQHVTTNDVYKLSAGKTQYSTITNEDGCLLDDILVYCFLSEKQYLLVVNSANTQKIEDWLCRKKKEEGLRAKKYSSVYIQNASEYLDILALQGPDAKEILSSALGIFESRIPSPYHFSRDESLIPSSYPFIELPPIGKKIMISATGYTGERGYELYLPTENTRPVWDELVAAGARPAGLGARDSLRLEMGYCLYGQDIDESISPLEAGLGWIVKEDTEFIGATALAKQRKEGIKKKLFGFIAEGRGIPRSGAEIISVQDSRPLGKITSGGYSPTLKQGIGMGYLNLDQNQHEIGTQVYISMPPRKILARVSAFPFVKTKKGKA
ncbi:MAG: glycine cleavage system aminomethyltransferase GcvT [Cytophagales bacterium]|nr:glycine cleavage system aminomethyltransferase GcvT [Cytophagales bacterium]